MYELSLVELESELAAELPAREMMCHRARKVVKKSCGCSRGHHGGNGGNGGTSAGANNGSVANANSTNQTIVNPQTAIVTGANNNGAGQFNGALVAQVGANANNNTNTQFGVPVNYQG